MATSDPTMTLQLIDTIQRLGVGYYFQEEINNILEKLTKVLPDDDLYILALLFRLRRHNGLHTNPQGIYFFMTRLIIICYVVFNISSSLFLLNMMSFFSSKAKVFHNFMDANGELNKSSSEDIQGLLSLYEASYMGSTEEYILSNAKEITSIHLSRSVSQLSPKLHQKVVDALRLPRHMRMQRLEARRYIEEYASEDDHNPILLEFAKIDYNMVQSVLQRELLEVTWWWEHLGLSSKLFLSEIDMLSVFFGLLDFYRS
ncbi:putative R-linalool synthase [Helianthus annuus]|uniref:Putative terpenoid cyclases/protein prenyltransferase alpha-alpha toroid n=1 Tax=Helianthus annuus TaxID=4232 RepID=A0A251SE66_HELAN|nr:putative R-linalool synthase [Helianthus annuus]KAJ0467258.1 putative R-linalool synthase [Helianthus annuus]KAJ0658958.1 putative R-linalool synthase [Helianthus annuus]KAJ0839207.1 putative R-linalool synthase [Helianthus annuus]